MCPHAVRFVLINAVLMLCFAGRFPSLQQMLVGEWCCRYSCAHPRPEEQMSVADASRAVCVMNLFSFLQ